MLSGFKAHIEQNLTVLSSSKLLLACSGGLDSMVLAHLLLDLGVSFALAHCNYKLRGTESDGDEIFVKDWGRNNGVAVYTATFDLSDEEGSIQLKARELRYDWFVELQEEKAYDFVLTAHHANDNLETFVINLSRGTGIDGLIGIPMRKGKVIRPLLPFKRTEILSYARERGIQWREDRSNSETKYLRNSIRHEIVPKLETLNPNFLNNFTKTQNHLFQSKQLLADYKVLIEQRLFEHKKEAIYIHVEKLKQLKPLEGYLHLLFGEYGFTQWEDLLQLLDANSGKEIRSKTHRIIKDRKHLIFSGIYQKKSDFFIIEEDQTHIKKPIHLSIEEVGTIGEKGQHLLYVDKKKLHFPLVLRKWKKGDYFYPLGMRGQKKVSKFFKDEKYNTIAKESQWLLCSGDEIVWLVGRRADDRFKVTETSQRLLKIRLV